MLHAGVRRDLLRDLHHAPTILHGRHHRGIGGSVGVAAGATRAAAAVEQGPGDRVGAGVGMRQVEEEQLLARALTRTVACNVLYSGCCSHPWAS